VVLEVLRTYIREHSALSKSDTETSGRPGADVQAAISVLARRPNHDRDTKRLRLSNADLRGLDLSSSHFEFVDFSYTDVSESVLTLAQLQGASFHRSKATHSGFAHADLSGADMFGADLANVIMCGANLKGAYLVGCWLNDADLGGRKRDDGSYRTHPADLAGANLTNASLERTILIGVDLSTVSGLTADQVRSAITDESTTMPSYLVRP